MQLVLVLSTFRGSLENPCWWRMCCVCKETCDKEYNCFHITHNRSEINMQLKSTCKRIDNIPTKIVTQDIPWETLIEGKTQPPKASITMYYSAKMSLQYNHGSLQSHSHHWAIHVNKHESTHLMSCFQPSQMLPWLTCQAFAPLDSCLIVFPSCHLTTITLVAAYIVASPTKPPSGIT